MGAGTDFAGTREYAPGDPPRRLNWRAEALWDRPLVNLYEEERAIDTGVVLDCRCGSYGNAAAFEAAVTGALSLAEALLDQGDRVAFVLYGDLIIWAPPGSGRTQRHRIRQVAAQARLGDHQAFVGFDNLPLKIFPPRSLVLLVSPLERADVAPLRSLRALGYEVAVLRPDIPLPAVPEPAAPAQLLARRVLALENVTLLARLLRAGITVLDWDPALPLARARQLAGAPR